MLLFPQIVDFVHISKRKKIEKEAIVRVPSAPQLFYHQNKQW